VKSEHISPVPLPAGSQAAALVSSFSDAQPLSLESQL